MSEHTLPRAELTSIKTKGGKEAYAAITIHIPLDEHFAAAAPFLIACQEFGCVIAVDLTVIEEQRPLSLKAEIL